MTGLMPLVALAQLRRPIHSIAAGPSRIDRLSHVWRFVREENHPRMALREPSLGMDNGICGTTVILVHGLMDGRVRHLRIGFPDCVAFDIILAGRVQSGRLEKATHPTSRVFDCT